MEGVALEQFNKFKTSSTPMKQFNSHLYEESDQDSSITVTHLNIIIQFLLTKK